MEISDNMRRDLIEVLKHVVTLGEYSPGVIGPGPLLSVANKAKELKWRLENKRCQ